MTIVDGSARPTILGAAQLALNESPVSKQTAFMMMCFNRLWRSKAVA